VAARPIGHLVLQQAPGQIRPDLANNFGLYVRELKIPIGYPPITAGHRRRYWVAVATVLETMDLITLVAMANCALRLRIL